MAGFLFGRRHSLRRHSRGSGNPLGTTSTSLPSFPRKRKSAAPSFPLKRESIGYFVELDPRFPGDDAAVSNRCDPSGLALRHPRHFSLVSLYMTCLRATGSNFLISIFSGISFLFLLVV